jgi:hypothetical protein
MTAIVSLKTNVTEREAVDAFRGGVAALPWPFGRRLRSVALVHVPFRLYRIEIANGTRLSEACLALDAVDGSLDPYRFEVPPEDGALVEVEARNRLEARLDPARSVALLEGKLRRMIFQTGFFRVRDLRFHAEGAPLDLHVPYWLGFYGETVEARLRVLDAVRRRFEGAKARALFEGWLLGGGAADRGL